MAKVDSPILSLGARGTIAGSLTFSSWRGVKYARQRVIPANPQSSAQTTTRSTFATLREMWKLLAGQGRDPWTAFAEGRRFIGLNAFVGENVRAVRGDPDFANFIGSPGAKGGIPAESMSASTGGSSGEIDVTFQTPTPPEGWDLDAVVAMAFPDQDPTDRFESVFTLGETNADPYDVTLSVPEADTLHVVSGWLRWLKPDGTIAFSPSITTTATSAA